jgi:TRAF3-interacting protein 1
MAEGSNPELDRLIEQSKNLISTIIQRPKMTEKLLSKPPFRFIHDTITAIMEATQFGVGLYSGDELNSAAITEKQQKIDYLEKIFNLVGICKVQASNPLL